MVQRAPPRRGVLPHPAGAPAGRAHQESEADAAAAPPGGRAHALGHRLRGQVPPAARGGGALPAAPSTTSSPSSRSETWRRSGARSGRKPCTSISSPAAPPASSPSSGTPWPTRRACSGPALPAPTATDRCTSASSKRWRNADAEASA